jgi:hypothetical protein
MGSQAGAFFNQYLAAFYRLETKPFHRFSDPPTFASTPSAFICGSSSLRGFA